MINYDYYKVFYCVGKHKSITHAAAELCTSQPAVTRVIRKLEDELGCTLYIRTKAGVEFTNEGKLLFDYVSVACQQLIRGEEALSQSLSIDCGVIRISSTVTALNCYLFEILDMFRAKYPKVRFIIRTSSSDKTIERLKSGESDLAFVTTPFTHCGNLRVLKIRSFQDILIAGDKFSHLADREISLKDLEKYPFICLAKGTQMRQFVDEILTAHGASVKPDIEPDSIDLVVPMVAHNWGIAIAPDIVAQPSIDRGKVFALKLAETVPSRSVCMLTSPSRPQNRATRELIRLIKSSQLLPESVFGQRNQAVPAP